MKFIKDLHQPFCLIQRQDGDTVLVLEGLPLQVDRLADIPRREGKSASGPVHDTFCMLPFAQVEEKRYRARKDGEKILCLLVERQREVPVKALAQSLPSVQISLRGKPRFNHSDKAYGALVRTIVEKEIGNGAGANFVVPRKCLGTIKNFTAEKALSVFRNLLLSDYGSYWKYLFFSGDRFFVGSTPERHLSVQAGQVKMNPISGTFRKEKDYRSPAALKADLTRFLENPKEINELFMVVDEELKMMARMCEEGGLIVGPLLKEMSRLIHSEYLLVGDSRMDIVDLLRESMFASTVTGSPLENACNVIYKYDPESRGYYGSAAVLIGRDAQGDTLDSAISIRTAEIGTDGRFSIGTGATLVRDSIPEEEVRETSAKISAVLNSILQKNRKAAPPVLPEVMNDEDLSETLQKRNQDLSKFWFFYQEKQHARKLQGRTVTIIDNEDDFMWMQKHMLTHMGAKVDIVRYNRFRPEDCKSDIVIVGPGPGNPSDPDDGKMNANLGFLDRMLKEKRKFLCICLGHQLLCRKLGYSLARKKEPSQGVQKRIDLFGEREAVGFYNTFTGVADREVGGVRAAIDGKSREIYALKGPHFAGFQFHPESILSKNGYRILQDALSELLEH